MNCNPVFSMHTELRNVIPNTIGKPNLISLHEQMNQHRGDGFGSGISAVGRLRGRYEFLGKRRITRSVAPGMTDRSFQYDLSMTSKTKRYSRMDPGSIQVCLF